MVTLPEAPRGSSLRKPARPGNRWKARRFAVRAGRVVIEDDVELEDWEERAAIRQWDGGATKAKAEAEQGASRELFGTDAPPERVASQLRLRAQLRRRRATL